jgi:hypothetical protein
LPPFLLCVLGFGVLASAMARHQEAIFGRPLQARVVLALRCTGWCALALALAAIVAAQGWALGLVSYSGQTSLAAGLVYVALVILGRGGH